MGCKIFLTGTIALPIGTKISKEFKTSIAEKPSSRLYYSNKEYDVYCVTTFISSCLAGAEDLKSYFMYMAKKLKAFRIFGMIIEDRNPEDCIRWQRGEEGD